MNTPFNAQMNPLQARFQRNLDSSIGKIGESEAVRRFLSKYGSTRTKATYLYWVQHYLDWLKKEERVELGPDGLIEDNLRCIHGSEPMDVRTKRRHLDYLNTWINESMVKQGSKEATRRIAAASVKEFYKRNDSALFGDWQIASTPTEEPEKPLKAQDIRLVLKALSASLRVPFLFEWQSGIEINRILMLTWAGLKWGEKAESPFRIDLYGRKTHKRGYSTFIGHDTLTHLKALGPKSGADYVFATKSKGEVVSHAWLNMALKRTAAQLMKEKLIDDYPASSWRSHMLRHSFETERLPC
jgi:hypothetical protein